MNSYQCALAMRALIISEIPQNGRIATRDIANTILELEKAKEFDFAFWAGAPFVKVLQSQVRLDQIRIYFNFKVPFNLDLEIGRNWLELEVLRGESTQPYLEAVKHEIVEPLSYLGYQLKL